MKRLLNGPTIAMPRSADRKRRRIAEKRRAKEQEKEVEKRSGGLACGAGGGAPKPAHSLVTWHGKFTILLLNKCKKLATRKTSLPVLHLLCHAAWRKGCSRERERARGGSACHKGRGYKQLPLACAVFKFRSFFLLRNLIHCKLLQDAQRATP